MHNMNTTEAAPVDDRHLLELADHIVNLPGRQREQLLRQIARSAPEGLPAQEQAQTAGRSSQLKGPINGAPLGYSGLTEENVEEAFHYHPWNPDQVRAGQLVVEGMIAAAKAVLRNVPPGPDRSTCLRKLREARMDANSAITHYGRY